MARQIRRAPDARPTERPIIRRLVTNTTDEPKFVPFTSLPLRSDDHYVLFHGTFVDNIAMEGGIATRGLDPREGGGDRGAYRHEQRSSSDARGLTKFATDPNIAMIYAKAPTEMTPPQRGALLAVVIDKRAVTEAWSDESGGREPFWRRERGGEDGRVVPGIDPAHLALNEPGGKGEHRHIRAVETNVPVPPHRIVVIGVYLPPRDTIDEEAAFAGSVKRHVERDIEAQLDEEWFEIRPLAAEPD